MPLVAGFDSSTVILIGGGARSAAYRQVLADLVGRPIHRLTGTIVEPNSSVDGAAIRDAYAAAIAKEWTNQ